MLIRWEWPVQIILINFGTQVLLKSIALRSLTVEGFVPTMVVAKSEVGLDKATVDS